MTPSRALVLMALTAVLAAMLSGCDLFKPAEPEPPVGEVIVGNYTALDSTLATMAKAVRAKGQLEGASAYLRGLADPTLDGRPFVAEFDPATVARYQAGSNPPIPNPWRRDEESSFYRSFAGSDGAIPHDMAWSQGLQDDPPAAGDSALVYRHYRVYGLSQTNTVYTIAYGQAELMFVRTGRGWVMVRWIDREDASAPPNAVSYGMLRLNHR